MSLDLTNTRAVEAHTVFQYDPCGGLSIDAHSNYKVTNDTDPVLLRNPNVSRLTVSCPYGFGGSNFHLFRFFTDANDTSKFFDLVIVNANFSIPISCRIYSFKSYGTFGVNLPATTLIFT